MFKYRIEFYDSEDRWVIGESNTIKESMEIIIDFLKNRNYESILQRTHLTNNKKEIMVDVGSWSQFFFISKNNGERIKEDYMSYTCTIKENKECDGCEECQQSEKLRCEYCDQIIEDGEIYFNINDHILCKECTDDIYGNYA